jgi:hypothetical protein
VAPCCPRAPWPPAAPRRARARMFHALPQRHEERSEHELQTDNGPDLKRIPTNSHLKARPIRRGPHRLGQTCTSKSERHPIEKHGGGAMTQSVPAEKALCPTPMKRPHK